MSYRNIEVDGKSYKYTVGKTHTKIHGFEAVLNTKIGTKVEVPNIDCFGKPFTDVMYRVRPKNIVEYIKKKLLT